MDSYQVNYEFHLENNTADLITRVRTDGLIIRDVIYSFHASLKSIFFLLSDCFKEFLFTPTQ